MQSWPGRARPANPYAPALTPNHSPIARPAHLRQDGGASNVLRNFSPGRRRGRGFCLSPISPDILTSEIAWQSDTAAHSFGLGGRNYDLISAIYIGLSEVLEFACDSPEHVGRRDKRAWFQPFKSYSDGVLLARSCGWTESADGWFCPACSRKAENA